MHAWGLGTVNVCSPSLGFLENQVLVCFLYYAKHPKYHEQKQQGYETLWPRVTSEKRVCFIQSSCRNLMQVLKQRWQKKNALTGFLPLAGAHPALWCNRTACQGVAPSTLGWPSYINKTKKTTPHRQSHRWVWSGQFSIETLSSPVTLCGVTLSVNISQDKLYVLAACCESGMWPPVHHLGVRQRHTGTAVPYRYVSACGT